MTSGPYTLTAAVFGSTWSELDANAQDVITAFRNEGPASITWDEAEVERIVEPIGKSRPLSITFRARFTATW